MSGYSPKIEYHPSGLLHRVYHTGAPRLVQEPDPNGMARPARIFAKLGSNTLWSTGFYSFDGAGNVKSIGGSSFVYDRVSRLTSAKVSLGQQGTGSLVEQGYSYDAFGNLLAITGNPGRTIPTDSSTNRLSGSVSYDAAGNLLAWNGNLYEYDPLNMMTRLTTPGGEDWLYVYTADDERIWMRDLAGATNRYTLRDLSAKVLREYTAVGDYWTRERDYIYQGGQLLAAETPEGLRHFYPDHLGTPRLITDAAGIQVAYHVYFPFGEEAGDPLQNQERMKFTGHEQAPYRRPVQLQQTSLLQTKYTASLNQAVQEGSERFGTESMKKAPNDWKEASLRSLASRLILTADEVALRGEGRARFLYLICKGESAEVSWDENDKLWVEFWDRTDEDEEVAAEVTFDDINSAEKGILKRMQ